MQLGRIISILFSTKFLQIYRNCRVFWEQMGPGPMHLNVWLPTASKANLLSIVIFNWNVAIVR